MSGFPYWIAILPFLTLVIESFDEDEVKKYSIGAFVAAVVIFFVIPALGCLIITVLLSRFVFFTVPGELYTSYHNSKEGKPVAHEPLGIAGAYVVLLLLFFFFADTTNHLLAKEPWLSWNQDWGSDSFPIDLP